MPSIDPRLLQQMFSSPGGQGMSFAPPGQGGAGSGEGMQIGPSFQGPDQFAPAGVQGPEWTPPPVGNSQQWTPPPTGDEGMGITPPRSGGMPLDLGALASAGANAGAQRAMPQGSGPGFPSGGMPEGGVMPEDARQKLIDAILRARMGQGGL
jgi:hypothetical protein